MFLKKICLPVFLCLAAWAQDGKKGLEIDFLTSYYDQDGDHSPVTGGLGTEELQSASPVFVIKYTTASQWALTANLGVDNITSASTDRIDEGVTGDHVSGASRLDNRVFSLFNAGRQFGRQNWGFTLGFSKEYDYRSINGGVNWSMDFNQKNSNLAVTLHHYADTVDLYDINGVNQGEDDRTTTDLSATFTQVLGTKTVVGLELSLSNQSGFLSSPFQEVILTDGDHVAERLPDSRRRTALRFSLNHAFSDRLIQRSYYRIYDDDFGIQAHSVELETHFLLPFKRKTWLYPIFRYHTQTGSDYFGLPQQFSAGDPFYTADRDLSEFDSMKYGLGMSFALNGRSFRRASWRATYYDRDDGLTAFTLAFGLGWSL